MRQTSFNVDDITARLLQDLQATFGVSTNAAVIRKALALARIVARHAREERSVVIHGPHEGPAKAETVLLAA